MALTIRAEEPRTDGDALLTLELPYPPSNNAYWRHVIIGRRAATLLSAEGRAYKSAVKGVVTALKEKRKVARPCRIDMELYPPDRRKRDLDNCPKGIMDSLVEAGVLADDSTEIVKELRLSAKEKAPGGKVIVKIFELR